MRWTTKQLSLMALLTAVALAIHVVEAQIPAPVPIPGVKLGLANIITVYAVFTLGPGPALMILVARILLGSLFSGVMSLFYSLAGGLLCFAVMLLMRCVLSKKQIWIASIVGAVFHNIGQILVAIVVTGTPAIVSYLPVLLLSGIVAGLFTGLAAQYLIHRLEKK